MNIRDLLAEKKTDILQKWFNSVLSSYPNTDAGIPGNHKNPYAGSIVGQSINESLEGIFKSIIQNDGTDVHACLDDMIRIRAIQEISPSHAIGFIFHLKQIIRDELKDHLDEQRYFLSLLELESRIDALANISFDIFMRCREKLYELRANEMRNWTYRVVKKSRMYRELSADE